MTVQQKSSRECYPGKTSQIWTDLSLRTGRRCCRRFRRCSRRLRYCSGRFRRRGRTDFRRCGRAGRGRSCRWLRCFSFLFTRRQQCGTREDEDIFFHSADSNCDTYVIAYTEQGGFLPAIKMFCRTAFKSKRYRGDSYFNPCASATAWQVSRPSRVLIPPISAGCFLHAPSRPRSASNST